MAVPSVQLVKRRGDRETRRRGDKEKRRNEVMTADAFGSRPLYLFLSSSPCLLFSLSGLPRRRPVRRRGHDRVVPAARRGDGFSLGRSPGARIVFMNGRRVPEHRIDNAPSLFHVILAGEAGRVS